jgi:hypothetical protein
MDLQNIEVVDGMRLRKRKFREHLCCEISTIFKGVNQILPIFSTFVFDPG